MDLGGKVNLKEWHKKIKHHIGKVKKARFKTWMLLIALVPLCFADATLLRLNHIKMTELRDAVLAADDENNDEKIEQGLLELRKFTYANMVINIVEENGEQKITFGTGPFYLEHQYLRAAKKALKEAEDKLSSDANPNGNIYGMAGDTCKALALQNGWTWDNANFINCMVTEINKYPASDNVHDTFVAVLPSTELYRHNYASPAWTPSLAGWLILITAVIIVVIFIRFLVFIILRLSLLFI